MQEGLLTLYSEVESSPVHWLCYPYIAIGKITLLQCDPGDGKSTMMMNLIAELSKGGKLPDGKAVGLSQRVIYQCSEDGVSDTIKPRLEKCGADCRNVAFINEEIYSGLTLDDERIRQAIIEFRPKLVVIDPIQAYLGSDSDLQIAGRARKLMHIHPLIRLFDEEYSQKNYENLCEISKDYTSRYMNKNEMSCLNKLLDAYKEVCRYNDVSVNADSLFSYFEYKLKKNNINPKPVRVEYEGEYVYDDYSLDEVLKKSNIRVKWNEKFDAVQKAKKEFLNLRIAK